MEERSRSRVPWALSAVLLFGVTLAMRWPGVAMYDSVSQYEQALDGDYADWHPPIMARTWALLNHLSPGTGPFFLVQMLLWWGGLGLVAAALGRRQRHGAAAFVLLIGIAPLWLGWATVVLKDAQMACCLVAAAGLAAHYRLAERPIPRPVLAAMLVLVGYATLVRGNAVFATAPFLVTLLDPAWLNSWCKRALATLALIGAVLAASPVINHRLLGAEKSGVERSLPLYDLAAIGHRAHLASLPGLAPRQWAEAERRRCYTPFFWNPYGEEKQCGFVGDAVAFDPPGSRALVTAWAGAVLHHPFAYGVHRLAHWNATMRLWVDAHEPDAAPPADSEPNQDGLGARSNPAGKALIAAANVMLHSPLGWPIAWTMIGLACLWAGRPSADPEERLGRAFALSAVAMSASFLVVSIASDLRYHLWTMIAAALALVLTLDARTLYRRRVLLGSVAVLIVIGIGTAARLGLAVPVYVPLPPPASPVAQ